MARGITESDVHTAADEIVGLGFSRDTRKNAPQNSNNSFGAMT